MKMRRMTTMLILMMMIVSLVPAIAQPSAVDTDTKQRLRVSTTSVDADDGTDDGDDEGGVVDPARSRYDRCIEHFEENPGINEPEVACKRIATMTRSCPQVMEDNDVENPGEVCKQMGLEFAEVVRERNQLRVQKIAALREEVKTQLGPQVKEIVAEHRLERAARVAQDKPGAPDFVANLPEEKQKVFLHMGRAKQKELLDMDAEDAEEELGQYHLRKVQKGQLFKNRMVNRRRIRQLEEDFEAAKERYEAAKEELKQARERFEEAKKEGDSEAAMEAAKDYLLYAADLEIEALNKIKTRAEQSEELTEEEVAAIVEDIDAKIAELEEAKTAVEEATTKEEVQEAARLILKIGRRVKVKAQKHVMALKHRQVGVIVERSSHLEERLDCALSALEDLGEDTTEIDEMVADFSALIDSADDKHDQSKDLLAEARDLKEEDEVDREAIVEKVKESNQLLQEAQQDLRDAHQILKDILREVREAGGNIGTCSARDADLEDDEEYVIEEVDEDDNLVDDDDNETEVEDEDEETEEEEDDDSSDGNDETSSGEEESSDDEGEDTSGDDSSGSMEG